MAQKPKKEKEGIVMKTTKGIVVVLLAFLTYFFLGQSYSIDNISRIVMALIVGLLFFYKWKKSFFHFLLFALAGIFTFVSLEISFNLNVWVFFAASFTVAFLTNYIYERKENDDRYAFLLLGVIALSWLILAFNVPYRQDWFLENLLNVPFLILLVVIGRWFRLSKLSYSLIFIYMITNIIGSHYTYSEVPFGFWMQNFFELSRNHYDRIIHFFFGFLLAYPIREVFMRVGNSKGFWAWWLPIELVLGLSAVYELFEWWIAVIFGGDLGIAYLGTQGDIWDAQKDMFLAGLGAFITMTITIIILFCYRGKSYWKEFIESLKVSGQRPLGEKALERIINNSKKK